MVLIEGVERGLVDVCREDGWHLPSTHVASNVHETSQSEPNSAADPQIRVYLSGARFRRFMSLTRNVSQIFYLQECKMYTMS